MEKFPTPEEPRLEKEVVSRVLFEKGETVEAITLLTRWVDQEQRRVLSGEISDLEFNVALAELYADAGMNDYAIEQYRDAERYAVQTNKQEVADDCNDAVHRLRLRLKKY